MFGNSLLTQVIVAGISIGIIFTYIQPKLGEIKSRQDEIAQTRDELQRVTEVNTRLEQLYDQLNSIPQSNKAALLTYLPDQVDEVQVLKDLSQITRDTEVMVRNLTYEGSSNQSGGAGDGPIPVSFNLTVETSYEGLKNLLSYLERNNYPLVVESLTVTPTEGGFLDVELALVTYSFNEVEE
jgi:Tfp pilus assembly protein PilO